MDHSNDEVDLKINLIKEQLKREILEELNEKIDKSRDFLHNNLLSLINDNYNLLREDIKYISENNNIGCFSRKKK